MRYLYTPYGEAHAETGPELRRAHFENEVTTAGGVEQQVSNEHALAPLPGSLSFAEAAALPTAGFTALQALRDKGELAAGERVAINGASGGVGHLAVQITRAAGARVTGVASARNLDFLRELGAERDDARPGS